MSISLSPLPPDDHRAFDALLAELPEEQAAVLRSASGTLAPLLGSAPYLLDLTRINADYDGDTRFPAFAEEGWQVINAEEHHENEPGFRDSCELQKPSSEGFFI